MASSSSRRSVHFQPQGKGNTKRTPTCHFDPCVEANDVYFVVSEILEKALRKGIPSYFVQWETPPGYKPIPPTWEPEGNLPDLGQVLEKFERKLAAPCNIEKAKGAQRKANRTVGASQGGRQKKKLRSAVPHDDDDAAPPPPKDAPPLPSQDEEVVEEVEQQDGDVNLAWVPRVPKRGKGPRGSPFWVHYSLVQKNEQGDVVNVK